MEQKATQRRNEKEGILHFSKDIISALLMALVFIVYIIQAFRIPTGSMKNSLLEGDFLLGLKFVYGAPVLPFSLKKFPALMDPKPGDVVIFKYPGPDSKDYIKRCVAGPGDTVEIRRKKLLVNGVPVTLPPHGRYALDGKLPEPVSSFAPLRIPARGDVIDIRECPVREFLFAKHLIHQENPGDKISIKIQTYVDGTFIDTLGVVLLDFKARREYPVRISEIDFDKYDNWLELFITLNRIQNEYPDKDLSIEKLIFRNGKRLDRYVVKHDAYFMMGDNRDLSADSRYWGYLSRHFVKARAFILYFSLDPAVPWYLLPMKIRWNRIGKLIRSWDGTKVRVKAGG